MRIGVEATCWGNRRGYGRHARALVRALVRQAPDDVYVLFVDSDSAPEPLPEGVEVRRVGATVPAAVAASSNGRRALRDLLRMSRALSRRDLDVVLFPTVYSYTPVVSRAKKIVVIHDVIAEEYPRLTLPRARGRLFWRLKVRAARAQADAIVTVSEASREGIRRHFGIPRESVFVVGEAPDPIFRVLDPPHLTPPLASLGLAERRTVVHVGGFGPHKNLAALIAAFARLARRRELADIQLVLAGEREREVFHSAIGALEAQVRSLGIQDRVVFTGYLPDAELVALLNGATVLALPSLLEGFGLPAVEAAACGCPVVATRSSPLPEILGEGALYVDPARPEELERALTDVLSSPELRRRLREAGLAAAARLSWDAAARRMRDLIREVASR